MNLPGGWELIIAVLVMLALLVWVVWRLSSSSGKRRPSPTAADDEGEAVAAARAALTSQWRSTVVPHQDGGWVVRTWTTTPAADSRPSGSPDFVHRVATRSGSGTFGVTQVHP